MNTHTLNRMTMHSSDRVSPGNGVQGGGKSGSPYSIDATYSIEEMSW
jgi:hypothetical protein